MKLYHLPNLILQEFKIIFFLLNFLFILFFSSSAISIENISITGNKNITLKTILSFAPDNLNKDSSPTRINEFQKKLFSTGFFEDVIVEVRNNKIFVKVVENPLVNFFYIEGVKNKEINAKILEISRIKENSIFQQFFIKDDFKLIVNYLNSLVYLDSSIDYSINKIENNKINLFYKINLNNKYKINRIFFIGNKFFKSSTLKDVIFSSEHGWWKFFSNSTTPTEEIINYDISRLKTFYLNSGFYDIQVTSNSIKILNNNSANIIYSINSGQRYKVKSFSILDNSNFLKNEDVNYLNKKYKSAINEYYNSSFNQKLLSITNKYLLQSNYDLNINTIIKKIDDKNISINFVAYEQVNKKIVDKITVIGNNITDDFVIRNNILINEGDFYNNAKLDRSIEILKGKNLFKNVSSEQIAVDDDRIRLIIKVEEQPTGEISAGVGAGTNGVGFNTGINEANFLGQGIKLNANLNASTQKIFGKISYTDPDFLNSNNSFNSSFFVESNTYDNVGYENKIIGSSSSLSYEAFDQLFFNPGLSLDIDSVDARTDASAIIKKREGDYFTTKIFYNLTKNTKNKEFFATSGYTFGVGQGLSILSDIPYINNRIYGSYYNEFKENFVGSVKYKLESIDGFGEDIKFSDRLFVGSNNLRGFSDRGVGPKLGKDFIGGNYSFYTTLSSTIPNGLPEKWNAVTNMFLDTANVWGVDDNSTSNSNQIRSSIGLGLSWISPLGPISFTYAEPISKASTDDVEQFNFRIGSVF